MSRHRIVRTMNYSDGSVSPYLSLSRSRSLHSFILSNFITFHQTCCDKSTRNLVMILLNSIERSQSMTDMTMYTVIRWTKSQRVFHQQMLNNGFTIAIADNRVCHRSLQTIVISKKRTKMPKRWPMNCIKNCEETQRYLHHINADGIPFLRLQYNNHFT